MKFKFNNLGKDYDVEIVELDQGMKVTVNGKEFSYAGEGEIQTVAVPQTVLPKRDLSSKEITAVLAGSISELSVMVGDIVKPGQKLLTLAAMKMENEILAECEGRIKEIKVAKDQKVKEGDVLIVMA
jgi:biotin carboxyl carrier protein